MCKESPDTDIGELARRVANSEILNCFTSTVCLYSILNPLFHFIWSHQPPSGPATVFWLIFTEVWRKTAEIVRATSSSPPSVSSLASPSSTSGLAERRGRTSSQHFTSLLVNTTEFTKMPGSLSTIWRECPQMQTKPSSFKLPMQFFSMMISPSVRTTGFYSPCWFYQASYTLTVLSRSQVECFYHSKISTLPLRANPTQSAEKINSWIK